MKNLKNQGTAPLRMQFREMEIIQGNTCKETARRLERGYLQGLRLWVGEG